MRRILLTLSLIACLLGASSICPAQDIAAQTVLTVSISSYDTLREDVNYIGALSGTPDAAAGLEGMLAMMTQGKGLAGLDKTRPLGAIVQTDGQQQFPIIAFVPVTDIGALAELIGMLSGAGPLQAEDGVYEIEAGDAPTLFMTEKNGWAFVVRNPDDLANLPDDPIASLGGLDKQYNVAVRGSVGNVPESQKMMAKTLISLGVTASAGSRPDETPEERALRIKATQRAVDQLNTLIDDTDEIMVGINIDESAGTAYLDFQMTAVEGTETAQQMAEAADAKTDFGGFLLPNAAVTFGAASKLAETDVMQMKGYLAEARKTALAELDKQNSDGALSDNDLAIATRLLGDLLDVIEQTIDARTMDAAGSLVLEPGGTSLVAGVGVADGTKLGNVVEELVGLAMTESPPLAQMLKLNAESHAGATFHTLTFPVAAMGEEDAVKVLGPVLNVVLGFGQRSVYLAVGPDAMTSLKAAIDGSTPGQSTLPVQAVVSFGQILDFAAATVAEGDEDLARILANLEQSPGKDRLTIATQPIVNGVRNRIVIEEGVLRLLGELPRALGQARQAARDAAARHAENPFEN